jgi:ribosomal protein S18 acetylase RimI-like enzyme
LPARNGFWNFPIFKVVYPRHFSIIFSCKCAPNKDFQILFSSSTRFTMPLTFRPATRADAPNIVSLVNAAYRGEESRKGWTTEAELLDGVRTHEDEIATLIATPHSAILLALDDAKLVASVHLQLVSDAAFLGMFAVQPTGQSRGVGKLMMAEAERFVVREWNATKMLMDVISVRQELIAFYERRGYRLTGKTKPFPIADDLWTPKVKDMVLARMEKTLTPT